MNLEKFDELSAEIKAVCEPLLSVTIKTESDQENAYEAAKQIKKLGKAVEKRRKELTKPLKDEARSIEAYAKKVMEPLQAADSHLRKELTARAKKLEEKRRAEEERLRKEREAEEKKRQEQEQKAADFDSVFGSKESEQSKAERERAEFLASERQKKEEKAIAQKKVKGTQKRWTYQVEDIEKVPHKYLVVNSSAINAAIRSGEREIAGVKIYQETIVSVR